MSADSSPGAAWRGTGAGRALGFASWRGSSGVARIGAGTPAPSARVGPAAGSWRTGASTVASTLVSTGTGGEPCCVTVCRCRCRKRRCRAALFSRPAGVRRYLAPARRFDSSRRARACSRQQQVFPRSHHGQMSTSIKHQAQKRSRPTPGMFTVMPPGGLDNGHRSEDAQLGSIVTAMAREVRGRQTRASTSSAASSLSLQRPVPTGLPPLSRAPWKPPADPSTAACKQGSDFLSRPLAVASPPPYCGYP
jgi:hypothetical protein